MSCEDGTPPDEDDASTRCCHRPHQELLRRCCSMHAIITLRRSIRAVGRTDVDQVCLPPARKVFRRRPPARSTLRVVSSVQTERGPADSRGRVVSFVISWRKADKNVRRILWRSCTQMLFLLWIRTIPCSPVLTSASPCDSSELDWPGLRWGCLIRLGYSSSISVGQIPCKSVGFCPSENLLTALCERSEKKYSTAAERPSGNLAPVPETRPGMELTAKAG